MGNIRGCLAADHPDHIKTDGFVEQIVAAQIEECRAVDLLLFAVVYGLRRVAEAGVFSCFDLDEHIGVTIFADYINLTAFLPIISGFYRIAYGPKMFDGDIFTSFTEVYPLL